jgi:hypothetical protein
VEIIAVRFIDCLNNGAYKWIGNLFVNQNASALLQSFTPGRSAAGISADQAVLVMAAWLVGLLVVAAALQRVRDVA